MESARNVLVQAYNDQRPSEPGYSRQEIARSPDARRTVLVTALTALMDAAVQMQRRFESQVTRAQDELAAEQQRNC